MKAEWSVFKQLMRGETSLGWDETKKTIVADDEWWERKIKENAGYKKFKDKDLSLIWFCYNALFADIVATGERARGATQEYMSGVGIELHDKEENDTHVHLSDESGDDDNMQNTRAAMFPTSSISKRKSTDGICNDSQVKKRKAKCGGAAALKEDIHSLIEAINRKNTTTTDEVTEDTIDICIDMLEKIPGISKGTGIFNYTVNMFMKKEFRQVFLKLSPDDARQSWLEYNYQMFLMN